MGSPIRLLKAMLLACVTVALLGCAASSRVSQSSVMVDDLKPVTQMRLFYRNVELSKSSGTGYINTKDFGIDGFGEVLIAQATPAFAEKLVTLTATSVIDGKTPIPLERATQDSMPHVLVIQPKSATLAQSGQMTATTYVFAVAVLDPRSGRRVWQASIDVSKTASRNF